MLIAIPAYRISCGVGIDKGRAWSSIDEVVAWALTKEPSSIATLAEGSCLPKQVIVACLTRLMRFRIVEARAGIDGVVFTASEHGRAIIENGHTLPFIAKREKRQVSFIVECVSGAFFPRRQYRVVSERRLKRDPDKDVRYVVVKDGAPTMNHEANMARLSAVAPRGWDEQIASVDGRSASCKPGFLVIRVVDGIPRDVPDTPEGKLREVVSQLAAMRSATGLTISYAGEKQNLQPETLTRNCSFDPGDLVIGGHEQRELLRSLVKRARQRVIIHSTFLDVERFSALAEDFRAASRRGVITDLVWGSVASDDREDRSAAAAAEIARIVRDDDELRGKFRVHMRPTGSHSKLVLADTRDGTWMGAISSCNWLWSPFRSVELTVVIRDQLLVCDLMGALQRLTGRFGIADSLAGDLSGIRTAVQRFAVPGDGPARMEIVVGSMHDKLMRRASGRAETRMLVGTHRLGSVARPGMVIPAEVAAGRPGVDVALIFTRPSGPLRNRDAKQIAADALSSGVRVLRAEPTPLHGKFLLWDDDDLVVTSLNWGSANTDDAFPEGEIGIHIQSTGIAKTAVQRLNALLPNLLASRPNTPAEAKAAAAPRKRRRGRKPAGSAPAPAQDESPGEADGTRDHADAESDSRRKTRSDGGQTSRGPGCLIAASGPRANLTAVPNGKLN